VISGPNRDGIVYRAHSYLEDVPRHLFSFSTKTIAKYLSKANIRLTYIRSIADPYSVYAPLYEASLIYLHESQASETEIERAKRFWQNKMRRIEARPIRSFFNRIGAGSCFLVSGTKAEL